MPDENEYMTGTIKYQPWKDIAAFFRRTENASDALS